MNNDELINENKPQDDKEMFEEEYEELPLLKISDEDGNEMLYACLQELELNSKKYLITMELEPDEVDETDDSDKILHNPFDEDENEELEVFVFVEEGEEDGEKVISIVEDDDEFNEVVEEWNKLIETDIE